jgi:hypothetical protein
MKLFAFKRIFLLCAVLCAGCAYPPEEVERMREQLQEQLSRGQVYVIHSEEKLSYMIRNSEFNRASEEERQMLVKSVEPEALAFLASYQNYKYVRIYFLGTGTAGINSPYLCRTAFKSCRKTTVEEES